MSDHSVQITDSTKRPYLNSAEITDDSDDISRLCAAHVRFGQHVEHQPRRAVVTGYDNAGHKCHTSAGFGDGAHSLIDRSSVHGPDRRGDGGYGRLTVRWARHMARRLRMVTVANEWATEGHSRGR